MSVYYANDTTGIISKSFRVNKRILVRLQKAVASPKTTSCCFRLRSLYIRATHTHENIYLYMLYSLSPPPLVYPVFASTSTVRFIYINICIYIVFMCPKPSPRSAENLVLAREHISKPSTAIQFAQCSPFTFINSTARRWQFSRYGKNDN